MFFANENRARIIQENFLAVKDIGAIGKALGEAWRSLTNDEKQYYDSKATADKRRYRVEREAYERSKPPKIKKPISAYMFFCKETRPMLAAQFPNAPFTELGKKLGAAWKSLSESEKSPFHVRAESDKVRYQRETGLEASDAYPPQPFPNVSY
mmetsp:Transcript_52210/g.125744  ORF Transcript_52210/g.125744 Transcript_52210/m.125744 type:complete len:153 (-) Transcript_52210:262-720(-)